MILPTLKVIPIPEWIRPLLNGLLQKFKRVLCTLSWWEALFSGRIHNSLTKSALKNQFTTSKASLDVAISWLKWLLLFCIKRVRLMMDLGFGFDLFYVGDIQSFRNFFLERQINGRGVTLRPSLKISTVV
jgi:hypothetical protein